MTTFYDRKAERLAASGQAEAAKADAAVKFAQAQATLLAAQGEQDRAAEKVRQNRKNERAERRQRAVKAALRWVAANPVEILMAAIIVVPALLAWSAMSHYGQNLYGGHGVLLPLFTECAMWAFAFKLHQARKAGRPTGWLLVGTWVFTAVAAGLNFLDGYALGGVFAGLTMAVVSTGGVIAHQIITAAPMRSRPSRTERRAAGTRRIAERRRIRMERAAVRRAVGQLDADGSVQLLHAPDVVTLRRTRLGRLRLESTQVPGTEELDAEIEQFLRETLSGRALTAPVDPPVDTADDLHRDRAVDPRPDTATEPRHRSMQQLRDELREAVEQGEVDPTSAESIRKTLRVGRDRAKQLRDDWNDGGTGTLAAA
ncbi:hypothetical protein ACH347_43325 [Saccharopolyspora sp. 5N102]|uniref:hypothetical protein n=1 Tax=Saccharopolyspora sp. 5N102 TaxID=3375155 RepID=UPI0037951533